MTIKIQRLVRSCKECGYFQSGGQHECTQVGQPVIDSSKVAPFCPLSEYPAEIIAGMDKTISQLRDTSTKNPFSIIFSYLATKLGVNLTPQGAVPITLLTGGIIYLTWDNLQEITDAMSSYIFFGNDGEMYRLQPRGDRSYLYRKIILDSCSEKKEDWTPVAIAHSKT